MLIKDFINVDKAGYPVSINWGTVKSVPQFAALEFCEQNPVWHKEGNAFVHTRQVVTAMYNLIEEFGCRTNSRLAHMLGSRDSLILMAAALFHDIGKTVTTEFKNGNWHSYGHETESEKITRSILWDEEYDLREAVCALVALHMMPLTLTRNNFRKMMLKMERRLTDGHFEYSPVNIEHLFLLKLADTEGSTMTDENRKALDISLLRKCYYHMNSALLWNERILDEAFSEYDLKKAPYKVKEKRYGVIIIGLPGAGKNYFLDNEFNGKLESITGLHNPRVGTVSRDDIRMELGYCGQGEKIIGTEEQEKSVTEKYYGKIDSLVKDCDVIVFNDMNIRIKYRHSYREYAEQYKEYDWEWIYIYIEARNLNTNINRRAGQISEKHFAEFTRIFDWPKPDEYDKFIVLKQK